ncbi:hypothetical protein GGI25_004539 [Coemansia spiralis]|uniref:SWIRM domain-containing protein n=2 Tax=Coemansia TaxID=4863 RepID=A0A9W8G0A2_9FUNG|nr:hypothetical protein EDC05_004240 [Coemansia umbellata]KAJ2620709.1 hypothetical protein GGI26_004787 [Coemansia sp. RSA 1358]KAJ2673972.1 hypothetical protein GGI25_004539 [Coemansia spiralis]
MSVKSSAFAVGISAATDPSLSPRSEGAIPNRRASATSSSNSSADYVSYSRPANARLTGRVDKRKRRRPIRCLPSANVRTSATSATTTTTAAASIDAESAAFCTLKLPYLDDYQRNPTAYSRALMGTERAQATHSSAITAATDSTYATHNSHSSPLAAFRTSNGKRIHSTASLSSSSSSTSSPLPIPEFKQHESEPHMTRKSAISSIIHRLFPSLDKDALAALAAAAAAERSANPRLKKRSQLPSNNTAPSGKSDSADATGEPGSDDNRVFANTASTGSTGGQTPTTINNGNDPMYVGDKLGQEIFRLHPHSNSCPIRWTKAAPMDVRGYPLAEYLSPAELDCCSILRLHPEQYLAIKHALVRAGRTLPPGTFKKRDAQKLCRVDVNKTSKVFEWFCKLGWIPHAAPKFGGYDHHNDDYD